MIRNRKRRTAILTLALSAALLLTMNVSVFAAGTENSPPSSVIYSGKAKNFVFVSGEGGAANDLFGNFKNAMPGDTLSQKITVKNSSDNDTNVKIYLRSRGAKEGSEELMSKLKLTVTLKEPSISFEDSQNKAAGMREWICLGTFKPGTETNIDVSLTIPAETGNELQNAAGATVWEFMAEEIPAAVKSKSPKTGDEIGTGLYIFAAAAALSGIILAIAVRKKIKK